MKLLAPVVVGHVEENGLAGTYRGRAVTALIDVNNTGGYGSMEGASSSWVYTLTLGTGGQHPGKNWEVDYTSAEPRHCGGDEAIWRQVLAGIDAKLWRAAAFEHFTYRSGKGELSGSSRLKTVTLQSDVKEVFAAKSPPPPLSEAFAAQLDFLARMAEVNEAVNAAA